MIGASLQPIEGNAESVRTLAAALTSGAAKLSAINAVLVNIKAGSSWDSPAGEVFEQSVRESPPLLDALVDRYAGAALGLRTFAEELDEAQSSSQRAIEWNRREQTAYMAINDQMDARMEAGQPWDDLLARQNVVLGRINKAQRLHAQAWARFDEADRRLARRLRTLAEDILDDSWHYTALTKVQGFSQGVASLPSFTRAAPVVGQVGMAGGVVSTASGMVLLVFYGEGGWKEVATNAMASVTGLGARALKTGALAGARPMSRLSDGRRGYLGDSLPTRDRFLIGTRQELHKKYPKPGRPVDPQASPSRLVVPLGTLPTMAPTARLPIKQKVQIWRAQGAALARRQADEKFFDSWRAVSAGGPNAQRMFLAGSTLEKVTPKAKGFAKERLIDKPDEKATRPTYP